MSNVLSPPSDADNSSFFFRKKWTVAECERLVDEGLLDGAQYELIEGDIVAKMGQGRLHVIVVTRLISVLAAIFGVDFIQVQAPVGIGDLNETSDPEPDIAVLTREVREFGELSPNPADDVRLVVEAAVTSLRGDMTVKAHLYATAGIPEYWIVDIGARCLITYRDPDLEAGVYRDTNVYSEGEAVTILAGHPHSIRVDDFLP